jgi:hypothetical protein
MTGMECAVEINQVHGTGHRADDRRSLGHGSLINRFFGMVYTDVFGESTARAWNAAFSAPKDGVQGQLL